MTILFLFYAGVARIKNIYLPLPRLCPHHRRHHGAVAGMTTHIIPAACAGHTLLELTPAVMLNSFQHLGT